MERSLKWFLNSRPILVNDLYIDPIGYQVKLGQREIELTVKEFEVLCLFVSNRREGSETCRASALHFDPRYRG